METNPFQDRGGKHSPGGPLALDGLKPFLQFDLPHHQQRLVNGGEHCLDPGFMVEGHRQYIPFLDIGVGRLHIAEGVDDK